MEYLSLSRTILALCHDVVPDAATSARALSTALAVIVRDAEDPGLLLALVVRDLSEAAMRGARIKVGDMPPPRRRRRVKNVIDLSARRRSKRALDQEPA